MGTTQKSQRGLVYLLTAVLLLAILGACAVDGTQTSKHKRRTDVASGPSVSYENMVSEQSHHMKRKRSGEELSSGNQQNKPVSFGSSRAGLESLTVRKKSINSAEEKESSAEAEALQTNEKSSAENGGDTLINDRSDTSAEQTAGNNQNQQSAEETDVASKRMRRQLTTMHAGGPKVLNLEANFERLRADLPRLQQELVNNKNEVVKLLSLLAKEEVMKQQEVMKQEEDRFKPYGVPLEVPWPFISSTTEAGSMEAEDEDEPSEHEQVYFPLLPGGRVDIKKKQHTSGLSSRWRQKEPHDDGEFGRYHFSPIGRWGPFHDDESEEQDTNLNLFRLGELIDELDARRVGSGGEDKHKKMKKRLVVKKRPAKAMRR